MAKLKLRFSALALIAILLTLLTQEALAYYTVIGKATNVVTSGNIQFEIRETNEQGEPFPAEGVYIMPGERIGKRVTFESLCNHPFYLRAKLVYAASAGEGEPLPVDQALVPEIDENLWIFKDGWYYYNGIVGPREETPALFSEVEVIGGEVDNEYLGRTLHLSVVAEAVQSENNPIADGNYAAAQGWPQEQEVAK